MRLAIAVTEYPAASQTFVLDHVAGLLARGHAVDVHALRYPRQAVIDLAGDPLLSRAPLRVTPARPTPRLPRRLDALRRLTLPMLRHPLRALRLLRGAGDGTPLDRGYEALTLWNEVTHYQLLHAHSGQNGRRLLPLLAAAQLRTPLVVTFHGHDVHGHLRGRPADYYRALFERADALVVCSGFMRERLLALGAPADKLRLIPNPVDAARFPWRARGAVSGRPFEMLSVGRLVPFKGTAVLLQALARPELREFDWRLHLVGDGPLRAALEQQVRDSDLATRVIFHGALPRERVLPLLERSELYLAPVVIDAEGNTETQGVALLEAMAAGLPVIASAVGGIPETLGTAAAALVPPGDPDTLAAAIRDHLSHPDRGAAHSRAGRERVLARYQPAQWLDRLEALYHSLTPSNHPGSTP